jgi:hypothetical protein
MAIVCLYWVDRTIVFYVGYGYGVHGLSVGGVKPDLQTR